MSMYSKFLTDPNLERNGVVLDYGDFRVTVARAGGANKKFQKVLEAKTRPHRRAIETEMIDEEVALRLLKETYAETVVLNWELKTGVDPDTGERQWKVGIENPEPDGEPLPVTSTNVLHVFETLPDLWTDILQQAKRAALYRQDILEAEAGN